MIPINPAPEPPGFDARVRQPGLKWLTNKGLSGLNTFPPKTKPRAFWTACLEDLLTAYDRICAYASLRIAPVTGAQSVDHFAPKSRAPADTYEWSNYRLACSKMNARKNNFTDVLDPFYIASGTFELVVGNGAIRLAPQVQGQYLAEAAQTLGRLKLDDPELRKARLDIIDLYLGHAFNSAFLKRESPFIYNELERLNLLRP